jgi:hypothetical protein
MIQEKPVGYGTPCFRNPLPAAETLRRIIKEHPAKECAGQVYLRTENKITSSE